jgi:hypothetical protein
MLKIDRKTFPGVVMFLTNNAVWEVSRTRKFRLRLYRGESFGDKREWYIWLGWFYSVGVLGLSV